MERHEIDDELASTGAQQLLTSSSMARLAYLATDATPRVIPIGFYWTGDQVVVSTAATAPKVAALSARPDVALTIDSGDTPGEARALSIRGRASVRIVDGVTEEYLASARKTMDAEAAAQFEQNCRELYGQMARIAITPHWVRYYDFGAGRLPRFLQELVERTGGMTVWRRVPASIRYSAPTDSRSKRTHSLLEANRSGAGTLAPERQ
jgi:nitroimidazol reductase NimA-like FMN-containing flavoprotein (pyridoxamine 5'-phosphate oxidase superfamily)